MTKPDIYEKYTGRINDRMLLTDSQMGVYLECAMAPESTMYNIPFRLSVDLEKSMSAAEIRAKAEEVIKAHPALYASFEETDEGIFMIRQDFPEEGVFCLWESEEDWKVRPFDLEHGPLVRGIIKIEKKQNDGDRVVIFIETHHAVFDGFSVRLVANQICDALNGHQPEPETVDAFSLYDAEQEMMESEAIRAAEEYFDGLLAGEEIDSNLLKDAEASGRETVHDYGRMDIEIDFPDVTDRLAEAGVTKATFFMGVFGYVMAKMTGQSESLFGTVESGRKSSMLNNTAGMFVKTIPVVMHIDENRSGLEHLKELHSQFRSSLKHDSMPFAELSRRYGLAMDVMFVYQSDMLTGGCERGIKADLEMVDVEDVIANFSVVVFKKLSGYAMEIQYRTNCYSEKTVRRFADMYRQAIINFADCTPLKEITLISESDRKLLQDFHRKSDEAAQRLHMAECDEKTVIDCFRENAVRHPDKTSLVFKDRRFSFSRVDEITDGIAGYISSLGIGREQTVSVLIPRCEYMYLATIGILKAGAVYQPLDPDYPPERLSFMMEDADARLLIADRELAELVPDYSGPVLYTDEAEALMLRDAKAGTDSLSLPGPSPEDTYVLLYTSGTTGKPKGCRLSHSNIMAFVKAFREMSDYDENCISACYASYGFDAHMVELFPSMATGCELHIIPDEIRLDFPELKSYLEKNSVTHICMTTQVARMFALTYSEVKGLQCILTGGEKLASFENRGNYRFINGYGPSECTICVTGFEVKGSNENIPIGSAMAGNHLYVVDSFGRHVPVGVPGEMIICGPQVGKGYLNRPEKTAEVFVENDFEQDCSEAHSRCYRTGDIVRYLDDGNLEFIGRRDQQVKIRGFRIELTEVEDVIRRYSDVRDAVVIAVDVNGGKEIHAYVTGEGTVDIEGMNAFIKENKPAYMVPAAAMQIESIPLTTNQKVDRRKLPEIKRNVKAEPSQGEKRKLNSLEKELLEILEDITGEGRGCVEMSFADAGITSITSIRLSTKIYNRYGLKLSAAEILGNCSILDVEDRIISLLMNQQQDPDAGSETRAEEIRDSYPLTQTQMGIYIDCMRAGMNAYNIPLLLRLTDNVDTGKLKNAIIEAVKAHPSMLCGIKTDENGKTAVYPEPDMDIRITEEKIDKMPPAPADFRFDGSPLFSFRIIDCDGRYLMMELHHIIADGESMTILLGDIDRAYRGEEPEREGFTAFALSLEEEQNRKGNAYEEAAGYYDSVFRGVSADYLPCADESGESGSAVFHHGMSVKRKDVENFCKGINITPNVLFTGVFALTLARYTAHEDALFSTIYNGRVDPRTAGLVSMLVKTLPVYLRTADSISVEDFLETASEHLRMLRKHDIFSFADAASAHGVTAEMIFIYQGSMMSEISIGGEILQQMELGNDAPKAELSTEVYDTEDGFSLTLEYNGGRYSREWISTFADAYDTCLGSMLEAETLGQVEITSEKEFLRYETINDTEVEIPYRPAYRLIEEQVDAHPDKVAVVARPAGTGQNSADESGEKYEKLTYAQLDCMANRVAQLLMESGVKPGGVVGIMTERTKEIYVAEFGILKAGCAFLFLSPSYPDERVRYIIDEGEVAAVITTTAIAAARQELLEKAGIPVTCADEIDPDVKAERPAMDVDPKQLAYLIYTSGSTGKPKGVMICQENLINLADNNPKNPHISQFVTDVTAAVAAFTFDASIVDGYCALANGATVCIASDSDVHDPRTFAEFCLDNGVRSLLGTPSFIMSMLDYDGFAPAAAQLEAVVAGGEAFTAGLYEKLRSLNPELRIINGYGPSETSVACTCKVLTSSEDITIGKPLNNHKIYIVDRMNHVLPMGALGELLIMGRGVGRGYMNRDDLTKKSFLTLMGQPAYRSGDLALISHDGEIRFHGRMDNQVKLRGLRVELGEIENAINSCDGVKSCIVTVNGPESNRYLAAFYTGERRIDSSEITESISGTLTEYMIPRVLMQLDEMPMTANGKIDKRALPEPSVEAAVREYAAPANEAEKCLAEAFRKALGLEKVGVNDDFFELGGTSLSATKVAMYAMAHGLEIAYKDVFSHPTVRKLSSLLGTSDVPDDSNSFAGDYSAAETALAGNTWMPGEDPGAYSLGNVIITGATGFLGIHVLKEFLEREPGDVWCILRAGAFDSTEQKLESMFVYYFEESTERFCGRIHCLEGDITDDEWIRSLGSVEFDTLINCAACVKHFANDSILDDVNVHGVENLVDLCAKAGKRLIQVSTVSVAGEGINGSPERDRKLHENELFIGQLLDNRYIISKFRAEKIILDAVADGLDAKIMRAGNLTPRYSDGEFQINHMTNGFMRRLHGYYALGCIPYSQLSAELEFSPIDETAASILALAGTDRRFTVFHADNIHKVFMADVVRAMNEAGLHVDCVEEDVFAVKMQKALNDPDRGSGVSGLIAYMNRDRVEERYMLGHDNSFTADVLNRIGFVWNITDDSYMAGALSKLAEFGFFDFDIE